jgi:hypothetical protein
MKIKRRANTESMGENGDTCRNAPCVSWAAEEETNRFKEEQSYGGI